MSEGECAAFDLANDWAELDLDFTIIDFVAQESIVSSFYLLSS